MCVLICGLCIDGSRVHDESWNVMKSNPLSAPAKDNRVICSVLGLSDLARLCVYGVQGRSRQRKNRHGTKSILIQGCVLSSRRGLVSSKPRAIRGRVYAVVIARMTLRVGLSFCFVVMIDTL